ncbi:hypothetical protein RB195_014078 [Necator americanus]|uniref:Ubiquitin-like domain-containing protein n=1 Tax=Necator americanus TaxID=51031 RepID=A0ABR1DYI9_NECAM
MDNVEKSIMIYMKNENGVAVPIYVGKNDRVEAIYMEAATTRAIHRGSLKGKAFFHNGHRLKSTDVIGDVGIEHHDTVRLMITDSAHLPTMVGKGPEDAVLSYEFSCNAHAPLLRATVRRLMSRLVHIVNQAYKVMKFFLF